MFTLKRFTLILTLIALTACSAIPTATPTALSPLEANRQKWESQQISHYRFVLAVNCFCAFRNQMPLSIEVNNGQMVSIIDSQGQPVIEFLDTFEKYNTIDKLFSTLDSALNGDADDVVVDYNAQYGYPQEISIDYVKEAIDDEIGFTVNEFEILK